MKIKVKDGKGKRVVTEIKRPDPQAVLIVEEDKEIEVTNEELNILVVLEYISIGNTVIVGTDSGKVIQAVYPDAIVFAEQKQEKKKTPEVKEEPKKTVLSNPNIRPIEQKV